MRRAGILAAVAWLALIAPSVAEEEGLLFGPGNLPAGWRVEKGGEASPEQAAAFSTRLGGAVERLWNQVLSVNGLRAQANVVRAEDEEQARAIEATLVRTRGEDFVARRGRDVLEVPGSSLLLARAIRAALGVPRSTEAEYEVEARLALVDRGVDDRCNDLFLLFLAVDRDASRSDLVLQIEEAKKGWTFGKTLRLAAPAPGWFDAEWSFVPAPQARERVGDADVYTFADPPRLHGVPYVDAKARMTVRARYAPSGGAEAKGWLEATPPWPVASEDVRERAAAIAAKEPTPRARALALLRHVATDVAYDGPVGSRHGVPRVMAQRFGRCWDKSDLFVTLARAAGLPARQVAGWVPPLDGGHVWAEVHLAGEGWIPADATTSWLGTSEDYLPFFTTSDGTMSVLQLRKPTIRRLR